ncbi:hypothetical protein F7725_009052, partial [Dissostichus mawsoni]
CCTSNRHGVLQLKTQAYIRLSICPSVYICVFIYLCKCRNIYIFFTMVTRTVCQVLQRRFSSAAAALRASPADVRSQRNAVFSREQARQRALYPRIEKIEVSMQCPGLEGTLLVMNRGMSTPLSCARHLTEHYVDNSALALVDGEPWSLHQPLTHSCSLTLLTFKDNDPTIANQAYWRSCSALLGQVLETAFKEDFTVELLSTVDIEGVAAVSHRGAQQLIHQDLAWEPLVVVPSVALEVFSHSRCKQEEVEQKASQSPTGTVMLHRCGDHVLLSAGPLVGRTGLCSQYDVTALHSLGEGPWGLQRRAQGLSLPLQMEAHHTVWRKLRQRAGRLVEVPKPEEVTTPASEQPATTSA